MLKLAIFASQRGWVRMSEFLLELDCWLSGLGGASRRIRRERKRRRQAPRAHIEIMGPLP